MARPAKKRTSLVQVPRNKQKKWTENIGKIKRGTSIYQESIAGFRKLFKFTISKPRLSRPARKKFVNPMGT